MFLKTEKLERNGSCVTLYQLSALQRIEYLEALKKMEATGDGDLSAALKQTIQTGALVVSMSLWHSHSLKGTMPEGPAAEVAALQDEVMTTWPTELIAEADYMVKILSGMISPDHDNTHEEPENVAEPVTVEKPLPVS